MESEWEKRVEEKWETRKATRSWLLAYVFILPLSSRGLERYTCQAGRQYGYGRVCGKGECSSPRRSHLNLRIPTYDRLPATTTTTSSGFDTHDKPLSAAFTLLSAENAIKASDHDCTNAATFSLFHGSTRNTIDFRTL